VEKHLNFCISQGFLAEEDDPPADIPNPSGMCSMVVEAKTVAKLGKALGQALAQAATNFIIRKQH
jgi:hypothetical protein